MRSEVGSTLVEVLVALSLFSLICLGTSMLFVCSKTMERKTQWILRVHSQALSMSESYPLAKNTKSLSFWEGWRKALQKDFPGSDVFFVQDPPRLKMKIQAAKGSQLPDLEFE